MDLIGTTQEEQGLLFNFLYEDSLQGLGEEFEKVSQKITIGRSSLVDTLDSMILWMWCCRERHVFDGIPYLPKYEKFDEGISELGSKVKRIVEEWTG